MPDRETIARLVWNEFGPKYNDWASGYGRPVDWCYSTNSHHQWHRERCFKFADAILATIVATPPVSSGKQTSASTNHTTPTKGV